MLQLRQLAPKPVYGPQQQPQAIPDDRANDADLGTSSVLPLERTAGIEIDETALWRAAEDAAQPKVHGHPDLSPLKPIDLAPPSAAEHPRQACPPSLQALGNSVSALEPRPIEADPARSGTPAAEGADEVHPNAIQADEHPLIGALTRLPAEAEKPLGEEHQAYSADAADTAAPTDPVEVANLDAAVRASPAGPMIPGPADALPDGSPRDITQTNQRGPAPGRAVTVPDRPSDSSDATASGASLDSVIDSVPGNKPRSAGRYRPRLAKAASAAPAPAPAQRRTSSSPSSEGTLDAEFIVTFQPGDWGIALTLLLRRRPAMAENIVVTIGTDRYELYGITDDLFEPVTISDAAAALGSGIAAEAETSPPVRWARGGRNLHVFSPKAGIAGFVSAPRVVIGQENAILCKGDLAVQVLGIYAAVGDDPPEEVFGPGIPAGWRCFRGIRPASAAQPDNMDAGLLALMPLPDAGIEFSGGIRISRSAWLAGHAPRIRILGAVPAAGEVLIDGQSASCSEAGDWTAAGCDTNRTHTVHYAGLSRTYEITPAPDDWPRWNAHIGSGIAICGALVTSREGRPLFASTAGPAWLVGRGPGDVAPMVAAPTPVAAVGAPSFEPVWIVPAGFSGSRQLPQLIGPPVDPLGDRVASVRSNSVRLWCSIIRSARYEQRHWRESDRDAANLWELYRRTARAVWRRSR
jgi:hypothetical protein